MEHRLQILIVMITYLGLLIMWGIYQGRKVKNDSDYAIAGRKLPGWAAALSERATGESSWALLGLPGFAYASGLASIWTAIGCLAGIITAWWGLAWRLRDEAEHFQINTFTQYIAKKHPEMGKWIRIIASSTLVFIFFFYVGAQFLGGGKTLHTMFEIDPKIGMLVTALIIIPYTVYGGFRSVVYTDVIQAIVMIIALIIGPIIGIITIATSPDIFANSIPAALSKAGAGHNSLSGAVSGFAAGTMIMGGLSWFFGYLGGMPQLSMRFMAISDSDQAKKARNIGIVWTIFAYIGALSIGWIGLALFGPQGLADQEYVMPAVMMEIFPPAIASILITGAIAAMISTADSLLILSASELSENLLDNSKSSPIKNKLNRSRLVTAILAVVALAVAYFSSSNLIFELVGYVWAGVGSTFSIVIMYSLFWKKYHGRAAIITILAGIVSWVIWIAAGLENIISSRISVFIIAGLAGFLATLFIPKKEVKTL
ncbi:MAG: sodium/proline symporter [Candidatus Marinimicrobia bacterium]|nr:sodium/proline symporter [Candidatus Neomarinimicrobiota bacterium]